MTMKETIQSSMGPDNFRLDRFTKESPNFDPEKYARENLYNKLKNLEDSIDKPEEKLKKLIGYFLTVSSKEREYDEQEYQSNTEKLAKIRKTLGNIDIKKRTKKQEDLYDKLFDIENNIVNYEKSKLDKKLKKLKKISQKY